jgi:hypothetical protein
VAFERDGLLRVPREAVAGAVRVILSFSNPVSWTSREFQVDGEVRSVPLCLSQLTDEEMWRRYEEVCTLEPGAAKVSRSFFLGILSLVAPMHTKPKTAVDYTRGYLIYEAIERITRVIDIAIPVQHRQDFKKRLTVVRAFLTTTFPLAHIGADNTPIHSLPFSLNKTPSALTGRCVTCDGPFYFLHEISMAIEDEDLKAEAARVLHNCVQKFHLLTAHLIRVENQQRRINDIMSNFPVNECVMIIDFKMKLEPVYGRQLTALHYGKRGISWHGAVVYIKHNEGDEPIPYYIDTIVDGNSTQDWIAVVSIVEAILHKVKEQFPAITAATLRSDNAPCYQNGPLAIFFAVAELPIKVVRIVHTETQDGKCAVDAHFAIAMRRVWKYVENTAKNVATAHEAFLALSEFPMVRAAVEVVKIKRNENPYWAGITARGAAFNKVIGRVNEIEYGEDKVVRTMAFSGQSVRLYDASAGKLVVPAAVGSNPAVDPEVMEPGEEQEEEPEEEEEQEEEQEGSEVQTEEEEGEDDDDDEDVYWKGTATRVVVLHSSPFSLPDLQPDESSSDDDDGPEGPGERPQKRVKKLAKKSAIQILDVFTDQLEQGGCARISAMDIKLEQMTGLDPTELLRFVRENPNKFPPINPGWAERSARNNDYARLESTRFEKDLRELFDKHEGEGGDDKISADQLREYLRARHPMALDFPSLSEVRTALDRFVRQKKSKKAGTLRPVGADGKVAAHNAMAEPFNTFLRELVNEDPTIKPRFALQAFREKYPPDTPNVPTDKQVKTKVTGLKMELKGKAAEEAEIE